MKKLPKCFAVSVSLFFIVASLATAIPDNMALANPFNRYPVQKTDAEWKKILTPEQYNILRLKGTEAPYFNKYDNTTAHGIYRCAACGNIIFSSATKFDSHTGWPSFFKPYSPHSVKNVVDNSLGMQRTEVVCPVCGSHLGHVFDDGPKPTGLRYCMNSAAMTFTPYKAK